MYNQNPAGGRPRIQRPNAKNTKQAPKGHGRKDKEQKVEEKEEKKLERVQVWVVRKSQAPKSTLDFEWPTYVTERQRIKATSQLHKNHTITEAFIAEGAQIKNLIPSSVLSSANSTPAELKVGDVVKMNLVRCSASTGALFDSSSTKQSVLCNTNLAKFDRFHDFVGKEEINVRVVAANRDYIKVDPLTPMFEEWLQPILKDGDIQKNIKHPQTIKVKNLHLTRGGFVGQAVIPNVSDFVGGEYTVDAFIPGSQIVLNIEKDFGKWEGRTVDAFVTTYTSKPGVIGQMSLICSVKDYLKFQGDQELIRLFGLYCENDKAWKKQQKTKYNGVVTGIISSAKKCGVFVEIPELKVTGMISMKPDEVVNYKPQDLVKVKIVDFEENTYFDSVLKQVRHNAPYKIEDDILRSCEIKPVLELA